MFKRPFNAFHPAVAAFLALAFNSNKAKAASTTAGEFKLFKEMMGPNIGAVKRRFLQTGRRSCYQPHQGKRECARRVRQMARRAT